ncbi:XRE family transcriptional regulator [Candidatus Methylobacter favarea]|uniref:XRE family transcriptional regulator n=1 Tax=Candidatus Methylobacter favarea TaxID=2707345 RepID=A0A8S0X3I6_9GAMM|nr:ImmA/IrrE family metallo-endopeptidase [Candidatus Methylobacter favarea]CAA9892784.1 XRE family transcriptional regulator [Candidatus Methylobacter favarea]
MFNATRFALARKRRGFTRKALAQIIAVSEKSVAAYEKGVQAPDRQTLNRIAAALNFPAGFFSGDDIEELSPDSASFRALGKMTAKQRNMALAVGNIALMLNEWIEQRFDLPQPDLPDLGREQECSGSGSERSPEAAAEALRYHWRMGELPVKNMIYLLESRGVRVFSLAIEAKEVDAFSLWQGGKPLVFLNTLKSAEHCRFDAAHELGHLVLHRHGEPQGQHIEREANAFASAFLMPRRSILAHAPKLPTLPHLIAHKSYWTVSVAALNYRLHALGLTTDWMYRTLCIQLSEAGYRSREPESAPHEMSQVLAKVFSALREDGLSKHDVARELQVDPAEIEQVTFGLMLSAVSSTQPLISLNRSKPVHLHVVK